MLMACNVLLFCKFQLTDQANHCLWLFKTEVPVLRLAVCDNDVNSGKLLSVEAKFLCGYADRCHALKGDLNELLGRPAEGAPSHFVVHHSDCNTSVCDDEKCVLHAVKNDIREQCKAWEAQDESSWQTEPINVILPTQYQ